MADRELVYRISVAGQSEAKSAIRSIVQEANRCANEEAKITRATVDAIIRERKRGSTAVRQVADAEAAHEAQMQKFLLRNAAKNFADLTRAHKKAEQDKTKAATAEAKQREQDAKAAGQRIVAAMNQEVRDFDKAEKAKTAIAKRERGEREREEKRSQAQSNRDAKQFARDRAFEERRLLKGISTGLSEGVGSGMRYSYGLAARGVREVAGGMWMNRGWDLGDIAAERANVSRTMRAVNIEARKAGEEFSFNEAGATSKVAAAARKTGFTQNELVGVIGAYSEKGSGATGVRDLDKIAMEARAIGADPKDVARLRANLEAKGMKSEQIDQFMALGHFSGKTGSFRFSDIAANSEMMLASFGPDVLKGGSQFFGLAQQARLSTGSGAMARTAFDSALDTVDKKRAKIEALGVQYDDKDGEAKSKVDVILDTIAAAGGDKTKLSKIFDPSRGGKAITTLVDSFNGAGGGDAGRSAMTKLLAGDESLKNSSHEEMMKDANVALAESSVKLNIKMEELRQKLSEKLLPVFDKLIEGLTKFVDSKLFSKGLDYVSENPKTALALGGLVAGFAPTVLQMVGNAAARFGAGKLVNTVPGMAKGAGGVLGAVGSAIGSAGAQPVFVTNWPGGGVGGGGLPDPTTAALGGEGALATIGGPAGAMTIGAAIAAAVGIAVTAAIAVSVLENHDATLQPKIGRDATEDDKKELAADRKAKQDRSDEIANTVMYGTNAKGSNKDLWDKRRTEDDQRKYRALDNYLDAPRLGMLAANGGQQAPFVGPNGNKINLADTGTPDEVKIFRKALRDASTDLATLSRAAKTPPDGFSLYKQPPK